MVGIPPKPQRMADVLPPEKTSPNEGELPPRLLEVGHPKESIPELKPAKPKRKLMPEEKRATKLFVVLGFTLVFGFLLMRFSFLENQVAQAITTAKRLAAHSASIVNIPQLSTTTGGAYDSLISASSTSFTSLLRRASFSDIWTLFTRGGETLNQFQKTLSDYGNLAAELNTFFDKVPGIFLTGDGPLPGLRRIQEQVASLEKNNTDLSTSLSSVKGALPINFSDYVAMGKSLNRLSDILNVGINWLEKPHHIILAFQNSSEMRPSGGFFGSYAELTFEKGKIQNIQVRDVTEADKLFSESIIPPKPLQYITKNWRAADANWYFDFPTSASQTLSFLEKSDLYKASSAQFDGFVAISPRVLEDIIDVTGPIELKDRKLTLTSKNFLKTIQNDVVAERAGSSTAPKSILAEIVSVLQDRLTHPSSNNRTQLAALFTDWIKYKDIQIYSEDSDLESAIRFLGGDGGVASSSALQNTDYFALVDSTIGGEKTNYVMDRNISLRAQIESDGSVVHHLTILRTHQGNTFSERWYTVPNKNHFRVLIPQGSQVAGASGMAVRTPPARSYNSTYVRDQTLAAYESSSQGVLGIPSLQIFDEAGKTAVTGWTITEAGQTTKLALDYEYRLPIKPDTGTPFRFVFDKQAGTEGNYDIEIDAPVGYRFKENQLPIFEYKSEDIPGRVVIDLTLEKT